MKKTLHIVFGDTLSVRRWPECFLPEAATSEKLDAARTVSTIAFIAVRSVTGDARVRKRSVGGS